MATVPALVLNAGQRLAQQLEASQQRYDTLNRYYDGEQILDQLGLAIPPKLKTFTVIVNWPRVVADSRVDRLDLVGFRTGGNEKLGNYLWDTWKRSGLSEDQSSYLDFEVFGRSYKIVDPLGEGGFVVRTVSPDDIISHRDPLTGRIDVAYQQVRDDDDPSQNVRNRIIWTAEAKYVLDSSWNVVSVVSHRARMVPVVPAFRNWRTAIPRYQAWPRQQGTSAIKDVISVTDSCARDLTNAQLAQETHAVPQRGVLGASKGDFVDETGKPLTVWESYFGRVWALSNPDAKTFEFSSANMSNFTSMVELYARQASAMSGLPPNYFGLAADDAASADAIRSRESKLVKSIERDQRALGDQARELCRVMVAITGGDPDGVNECEPQWSDPATPTVAQKSDAVTKLYATKDSAGRSLLPREMAWEELGWNPEKIERAKRLFEQEEADLAESYLKPLEAQDVTASNIASSSGPAEPAVKETGEQNSSAGDSAMA